ncbi:MAG: gamma carbonic anhydrase family protein, partial [Bacilli bacterium]
GKNVTIGHRAIIHGCTISDNVLVGMGSIILNGAKIGKNSIIGAGSLVTQYKEFEEGVLIMGSPAKVVRKLTEDEIKNIEQSAKNYVEISRRYL